MDALTAIFGGQSKVKLLRLFLFNTEIPFFLKEITDRTRCTAAVIKKDLASLIKANVLKKKLLTKEFEVTRNKKKEIKKVRGMAYVLNEAFAYRDLLRNILTVASIQADDSLAKRFVGIGRIKLLIASGVFIQNWDSRVDLLIVGDELNLNKIESIIRIIESEIGKEISYSAFETADFEYRMGIHDRLVRDILDFAHVTLLDRIGVEPK